MRHYSNLALLGLAVLLVLVLLGCGGKRSSTSTAGLSQGNSGFNVNLLSQSDPVPIKLTVTPVGDAVRVDVYADGASNAKQVYLNLSYDAGAYTPTDAKVGDFLGSDTVNLCVLDKPGVVPIGAAKIGLKGGVSGSGLIASVTFTKGASAAKRVSGMASVDPVNQVDDIWYSHPGGDPNQFAFTWTEKNCGDFNNDGEVSIADLQPVAAHYGQVNYPPIWGPGVTEVNITVLAPIAAYYGNKLDGYEMFNSTDGTTYNNCDDPANPGNPLKINRDGSTAGSTVSNVPDQRVVYTYTYTRTNASETSYEVGGFCASDSSHGIKSVPASGSAPGQPPQVTGLTATVGPPNDGVVALSWTPVTFATLMGYEVSRQDTPSGSWATIATVGKTTHTYQDAGLSNQDYWYRVRAVANGSIYGPYSDPPVQAHPWVLIRPPVPTGLTATGGSSVGDGKLNISWSAVTWTGLQGYHVYRATTSGGPYADVHDTDAATTTWQDTGLTAPTYYYVVTSFDATAESFYSTEASGSPYYSAQIVSASANKTTFDSSETATLKATTNPPDGAVTWSDNGAGGTFPGGTTGATVDYKVPSSAKTITISATFGNTVQFKIISTTFPKTGEQPASKFAYFDVTNLPSTQHPSSPFYPFHSYVADKKVIWLNSWATW